MRNVKLEPGLSYLWQYKHRLFCNVLCTLRYLTLEPLRSNSSCTARPIYSLEERVLLFRLLSFNHFQNHEHVLKALLFQNKGTHR